MEILNLNTNFYYFITTVSVYNFQWFTSGLIIFFILNNHVDFNLFLELESNLALYVLYNVFSFSILLFYAISVTTVAT